MFSKAKVFLFLYLLASSGLQSNATFDKPELLQHVSVEEEFEKASILHRQIGVVVNASASEYRCQNVEYDFKNLLRMVNVDVGLANKAELSTSSAAHSIGVLVKQHIEKKCRSHYRANLNLDKRPKRDLVTAIVSLAAFAMSCVAVYFSTNNNNRIKRTEEILNTTSTMFNKLSMQHESAMRIIDKRTAFQILREIANDYKAVVDNIMDGHGQNFFFESMEKLKGIESLINGSMYNSYFEISRMTTAEVASISYITGCKDFTFDVIYGQICYPTNSQMFPLYEIIHRGFYDSKGDFNRYVMPRHVILTKDGTIPIDIAGEGGPQRDGVFIRSNLNVIPGTCNIRAMNDYCTLETFKTDQTFLKIDKNGPTYLVATNYKNFSMLQNNVSTIGKASHLFTLNLTHDQSVVFPSGEFINGSSSVTRLLMLNHEHDFQDYNLPEADYEPFKEYRKQAENLRKSIQQQVDEMNEAKIESSGFIDAVSDGVNDIKKFINEYYDLLMIACACLCFIALSTILKCFPKSRFCCYFRSP